VATSSWPAWHVDECDVVVLGASYGGLVTAALLAQGGKRTVLVDAFERVGVPGGAWPRGDYWVPWGHRDGLGMRQNSFTTYKSNFEAADRLGIHLPLVGPHDPTMLCHLAPQGDILKFSLDPSAFEVMARDMLQVDETHIPEFRSLLDGLARTSPSDAEAMIPLTVGEWLRDADVSNEVGDALLAYLTILWSIPPEDTSVGRLILNNLQMPFKLYSMNHPEYGGNQGVVELYAQKFRELGGDLRFDQKPQRIIVEDGRAVGVRVRNSNGFTRDVRADSVVFTSPVYMVFDVIDESHFPADFVDKAWSTKRYETPIINLFMGLHDLPRRRRDGQREDTMCFQRLLFGPERALGGGWSVWSNACRSLAPEGKHLLGIHLSDSMTYDEARQRMERLVDYIRGYYIDLADVIEWYEYEWLPEPHGMSWSLKTGERAPMRTPVDGLFLAGYTTDVLGIDYDAEAYSAMKVADMILES
jgi:phytoene dehydrogenase-like protein